MSRPSLFGRFAPSPPFLDRDRPPVPDRPADPEPPPRPERAPLRAPGRTTAGAAGTGGAGRVSPILGRLGSTGAGPAVSAGVAGPAVSAGVAGAALSPGDGRAEGSVATAAGGAGSDPGWSPGRRPAALRLRPRPPREPRRRRLPPPEPAVPPAPGPPEDEPSGDDPPGAGPFRPSGGWPCPVEGAAPAAEPPGLGSWGACSGGAGGGSAGAPTGRPVVASDIEFPSDTAHEARLQAYPARFASLRRAHSRGSARMPSRSIH